MENVSQYKQLAITYATEVGTKLIAAIIFWIVGRWLIDFVGRMLQEVMGRQKVDTTLMRYVGKVVLVHNQ
jgi:small conductance mechanosensitive channel